MNTDNLPVFILAGGKSSRFGSDKALAKWHGQPLILHIRDALSSITRSLTVVADRADRYADLGLSGIADAEPHLGPLGGLAAALAAIDSAKRANEDGWFFLTACDWLGLRAEWVRELLSQCHPTATAVAFRGEYWEPCFALYHSRLAGEVGEAIAREDRSLQNLLNHVEATAVPYPADWSQAIQINYPEDLPTA